MARKVVVGRRGKTTIPQEIRKKLEIHEGTRLLVNTEEGTVVFRKVPSIFDLAGKSKMTKQQAFRLLDKMREGS